MREPSHSGIGTTSDLRRYLQESRESVLSALEGASEYDVRRPTVSSATNR